MNASDVQAMRSGRSVALIGSWQTPSEQIHQLANLLMLFSMLLSMMSPLLPQPSTFAPSYASQADLQWWPAANDAAPAGQRSGDSIPAPVASVRNNSVGNDTAGAAPIARNATLERELAVAAAPEAAVMDQLGSEVTPAWFRTATENSAVVSGRRESAWWQDPTSAVIQLGDASTTQAPALDIDSDLVLPGALIGEAPGEASLAMIGTEVTPAWLTAAGVTEMLMPQGFDAGDSEPLAATGICVAPISVTIAADAPALVTQGDTTTPYTFSVVISNSSAVTSTGPLTYHIDLPDNFYFIGNSAAVTSSSGNALAIVQPLVNSAPGVTVTVRVAASNPTLTLEPNASVTLTYRLAATTGGAPDSILTNQVSLDDAGVAQCSVAQSVNTGYCPTALRLPVVVSVPPYIVGPVNTAGDVYTATVRNSGMLTVPNLSLLVSPNAGFFFIGNSATGTSSTAGPVALTQPGSNLAPMAPATLILAGSAPTNSLPPGGIFTATFLLGTTDQVKSGQPLTVTTQSGGGPVLTCSIGRVNVPTSRGNLLFDKSPNVIYAGVGEIVTFTLSVRNSGLASLYNVNVIEQPDSGLVLRSAATNTISHLLPNTTYTYAVAAQNQSCTTVVFNRAIAYASIGNVDGTGSITNPLADTAYVVPVLEMPDIRVTIGAAPKLTYCTAPSFSVPVTVTVVSGSARELRLDPTGGYVYSTMTPGWTYSSTLGAFIYLPSYAGTYLEPGAVLTFTMQVNAFSYVCAANAGLITLTPRYRLPCHPTAWPEGTSGSVNLRSDDVPTLLLDKESLNNFEDVIDFPATLLAPGDTARFTVTIEGASNITNPIGTVFITDVMPIDAPFLSSTITYSMSTAGSPYVVSRVDDQITPTIAAVVTPTATPYYTSELYIEATYPPTFTDTGLCTPIDVDDPFVVDGYSNEVEAGATTCPACLRSRQSTWPLYFIDPAPNGGEGLYTTELVKFSAVCSPEPLTRTVVVSVTNGITWSNTYLLDPVGTDSVGPASVVADSVQVLIDDIDRTSEVTVTVEPTLTIAFDAIGVYSESAVISITYAMTIGTDAKNGSGLYNIIFHQGGYTDTEQCGVLRRHPVSLEIERGALALGLRPDALQACALNTVVLSVDGNRMDTDINGSIVLTYTTTDQDIITPTDFILGGGFVGQSVDLISATVEGRHHLTFTVAPGFHLTGAGTISFPLYRRCGITDTMYAHLDYTDQCIVPQQGDATGGMTTLRSNMALHASNITLEMYDRVLNWRFGVENAGGAPGVNTVVTNTLPDGIHYVTYTLSGASSAEIASQLQVMTGTVPNPGGPLGYREVITFLIPAPPANSSVTFDLVGSTEVCSPTSTLDMRLTQGCGDVNNQLCGGDQVAQMTLKPGPISLFTSNTQQADIPLCTRGTVEFIVKNMSLANVYDLVLTERITAATYVTNSATIELRYHGNVITGPLPFTPTTIIPVTPVFPFTQTLIWDVDETSGYPEVVRELLQQRGPEEELWLKYEVATYCSAGSPQVQGTVHAHDVCDIPLWHTEDSYAVKVGEPELEPVKLVRNVSENGVFAPSVLAAYRDTLVWQVTLTNLSPIDLYALFVTDTLPTWFEVSAVTPVTSTQAVNYLNWTAITGTGLFSPLPADATNTYWVTGTVGSAACTSVQTNTVDARIGCALDDVCAPVFAAQATVDTHPVFDLVLADQTQDQCASGPLTFGFTNTGARAGNVVVSVTLPIGLAFAGIALAASPVPAVAPPVGATGTLVFSYTGIAQQSLTNTLAISVANDLLSVGLCRSGGTISVTLGFEDSCGVYGGTESGVINLTVNRPNISTFSQTPVSQTVVPGTIYTWTLTLPNTGNWSTSNLVVTETLGAGWQYVNATPGSLGGAPVTATIGDATVITWVVGSLAAGQTWTAQVAARPVLSQTMYRVTGEATDGCADGGCVATYVALSFSSPLQDFAKQISHSPVSIAEPFAYTITAHFYGAVPYTTTQIVDVLPTLAGAQVFSHTDISIDRSGPELWSADTGSTGVITLTPAGGVIQGPSAVTVTIRGIISNSVAAQRGGIFTNAAAVSYYDDGKFYRQSASVDGVVKEPTLAIAKVVSPATGVRADTTLTYTLIISHATGSDAAAYGVVITDLVPAGLIYAPGSIRVTAPSAAVISTTVGNTLVITIAEHPLAAPPIYITYTATTSQSVQPFSTYTNTALVRYTSWPQTPDARNGDGIGANDYFTSSTASIQSAPLTVNKQLDRDSRYTVGDLITYTVLITLPVGATRNLVVTDTVPAGLLYVVPTSTVIVTATPEITLTYVITPSSGNGTSSSQAILRLLEPVNNTTGASAVLTWTMQLIAVDDANRTVNYNGAVKTNTVALTYVNAQNQSLSLTDPAEPATLYEPLLHIGKSYVTDNACAATLLQENFNAGATGWSSSNGAWSTAAAPGWVRAPSGVTSIFTHTGASLTDISYSALVSATSTSGSIGLVFRAQDSNNYYRFVWTGTSPHYRLERVSGGAPSTVATAVAAGFVASRWYHFEVRAVGDQFTIYRDGQQILSGSDSAIASGSVGFYVSSNNAAFDDVLVTRMGDDGCTVDVSDLITYTLTISNQNLLTGYDLVITDVLPAYLGYVDSSLGSNDPNAALTASPTPGDTGELVWTLNHLTATSPFNPLAHSWATITMTARVLADVPAGLRLTNQALLSYDNMAGSGPVGIERSYSGGSHSTAVRTAGATLIKSTYPTAITIGETFRYTLTFPGAGGSGGIAANLYTTTLTDSLPAGFRIVAPAAVEVFVDPPANIALANIDTSRSTTKTLFVDVTRVPSYTQVTAVITAVVENRAINQDGVNYTNTATLGWFDLTGSPIAPVTSNVVTNTVVEPLLIIEKSAFPTNVRPGDTVFYSLRIYHAPTSTVPAYNVSISDTLNSWLSYISGSWGSNNDPHSVAATGRYTAELPNLQAAFPVIDTSLTAANPLILRYQAVVKIDTPASTIITNVADLHWTSLLTDTYRQGEIRDGSGGVNDYFDEDSAQVSLDQFVVVKSGPPTVTAGSLVTYVIVVENGSPITGRNAYVVDTISFRVTEVTGTFSTPLNAGLCNPPVAQAHGLVVSCQLGDLPPHSSGVVTITGRIAPETPDGALVDDYATFYVTDSNGVQQEREDEAETQVETSTDLAIQKDGPATVNAGELITYTLVVTNVGPSTARGVDAKDILPDGLTFVAGSTTQGACTSSICQVGDMQPGDVVTMVITASVGSDVSGVITNKAQVFSATDDPDQSNNRDTATTTVLAFTTIHVAKVDMTDPAYAGNTYFYQVTVTNTGPAQANDVVITDILPDHVIFEGASPGCTYADGRVTCAAGDLVPGEWFGVLINVRVPVTITDGTLVTNTATITTSTNVVTANSVLTVTEPTLLLQSVNEPTDIAIAKRVTPATVTAGLSGGNLITYTLTITNNGPTTATVVQVTDLYPQYFTLLNATTSLSAQRAQCSNGGVCAIDELGINESALITLTFRVPASVVADTYTNTAHISSASEDTNLTNNTSSVPVTVLNSVTLQIAKTTAPNPATPGSDLNYTILVTNTGPSDATNVTVSDTLPAGFTPDVILSSQGGCTSFPCNLGTLVPNTRAWVTINGRIASSVTSAGQISNTARVTSTQTPVAVSESVTPTIVLVADVGVTKQGPATVYPGASVVYNLTVRNLGPSVATSTRITDVVPAGLTFVTVSGCTNMGGGNQVVCALGDLSAGAVQTILITATVNSDVYPGTSVENVVDITTTSTDNNLLNNRATADTTVLGGANVTINKTQLTTNPITAGELVTYTLTVNNTGPGMARARWM